MENEADRTINSAEVDPTIGTEAEELEVNSAEEAFVEEAPVEEVAADVSAEEASAEDGEGIEDAE